MFFGELTREEVDFKLKTRPDKKGNKLAKKAMKHDIHIKPSYKLGLLGELVV